MKKLEVKKFYGYFLNLILIWGAYLLYKSLPYYSHFLSNATLTTIFALGLAYTSGAFFYYFLTPQHEIKKTKGEFVLDAIKKKLKHPFDKLDKKEKTTILFILVKIFFLPIMLNFVFNNYFSFMNQIPRAFSNGFNINSFNMLVFPFTLTAIFLIDTAYFAFGYAAEAGFLKNKIISVEPTFLGWFVALICYPPFNGTLTKYISWYANDYLILSNSTLTFAIRLLVILFLLVYVGATIALGTKCSNLTNRGIVSRGPYKYIRHPAYISKNLAWWMTVIPVATLPAILSMGAWSLIYHLRSITEERHLNSDPNYVEYCKKVKYRYIPGIY